MQIKTCNAKNKSHLFSFVHNVVAHWSYTVLIPYTRTVLITYEPRCWLLLFWPIWECENATSKQKPLFKKIQVKKIICKKYFEIPSPKECKTSRQNRMFSKPREKNAENAKKMRKMYKKQWKIQKKMRNSFCIFTPLPLYKTSTTACKITSSNSDWWRVVLGFKKSFWLTSSSVLLVACSLREHIWVLKDQ